MEPRWQREPEAALHAALRAGALPAESKQLAVGGTDLRVNLKGSAFFEGAADRAAVFNSVRDALEQVCGGHIHTTSDHPNGASPHMTVAFRDTPSALEAKRGLAATGSLRVAVGGVDMCLPLRLVAGVKPPDCRVLIAHMPRGPSQRHTDVWRTILACAGYVDSAAACSASFFPCHAGRESLDGARLLAYAVPPPGDPTFRLLPRQFSYDCGSSFVNLTVADQDNSVREAAAPRAHGPRTQQQQQQQQQLPPPPPLPQEDVPPPPPLPRPPATSTPASQRPPGPSRPLPPTPHSPSPPVGPAGSAGVVRRGAGPLVSSPGQALPPGILPRGPMPSKRSTIFGPQPTSRIADVAMGDAPASSSPAPPPGSSGPVVASMSAAEVEASELAQGLWFWARDYGAADIPRADVQATLHRMGSLHPGLFRAHGDVSGTPPEEVRAAFLDTLASVNPGAAAAFRGAEDGYDVDSLDSLDSSPRSGPARDDAGGPWQVVGSRTKRSRRGPISAAKASSAAPKVPLAAKPRGARSKKARSADPPPAPIRERHPRAAQEPGRPPFWAGSASAGPVSAPTGSAGSGARRHGSR